MKTSSDNTNSASHQPESPNSHTDDKLWQTSSRWLPSPDLLSTGPASQMTSYSPYTVVHYFWSALVNSSGLYREQGAIWEAGSLWALLGSHYDFNLSFFNKSLWINMGCRAGRQSQGFVVAGINVQLALIGLYNWIWGTRYWSKDGSGEIVESEVLVWK